MLPSVKRAKARLPSRSPPFKQRSEGWYNPWMHECPLCGEAMHLSEREVREMNGTVRQVREWICPECDYFEEAETEG